MNDDHEFMIIAQWIE